MKEWISPIPKNIHLIWIGGEQPDYLKLFLKTFHQFLPEFTLLKKSKALVAVIMWFL